MKTPYPLPQNNKKGYFMPEEQNQSVPDLSTLDFIIYIYDAIDRNTAQVVTQQILTLDKINLLTGRNTPIQMIINSPGGEMAAAWQICDVMDFVSTEIHTIALGEVASAALCIFINGSKGNRVITEKTSIMSHQYSWGTQGQHSNLIAYHTEFLNIQKRCVDHYKKCTGLSKKVIETELLTTHDVFLNAADAIRFKLADRIESAKPKRTTKVKKQKNVK